MTASSTLRCDGDRCPATYTDTCPERWVLRLRAEESGWRCDETGDHCPDHIDQEDA